MQVSGCDTKGPHRRVRHSLGRCTAGGQLQRKVLLSCIRPGLDGAVRRYGRLLRCGRRCAPRLPAELLHQSLPPADRNAPQQHAGHPALAHGRVPDRILGTAPFLAQKRHAALSLRRRAAHRQSHHLRAVRLPSELPVRILRAGVCSRFCLLRSCANRGRRSRRNKKGRHVSDLPETRRSIFVKRPFYRRGIFS